jgi:hypothetical protein
MKSFHAPAFASARNAAAVCQVFRVLALVLLLPFVPTQFQTVFAQTPQRGPLQFDPLTPEERELATRLAEDNARVKELRGRGRTLLVSVELAAPKTANQGGEGNRHAEVLYYRYDGNQGVLTLVDLGQRTVREAARINGDAVPLTAAEVNEAIALAMRNRELTNLLGQNYQQYQAANQNAPETQPNRVEALRVLAGSANDPCYQHRCLSLLFRQGESFLTGTSVTVDLTSQTVRVERPGQTRPPARRRRR